MSEYSSCGTAPQGEYMKTMAEAIVKRDTPLRRLAEALRECRLVVVKVSSR